MRPLFMTAIVSAIVIASSWSCVTWTNVIPTSCWMRLSSSCMLLAELQVERAERLVEQEHSRLVDERAPERDALLLPARELPRLALREPGEPDELEHLAHAALQLALRDALSLEPERDVVLDRHVREERVALEDGVDVALVGREPDDVLVAEEDAPLGRLLEAADHPQRRRLPAARRAEQREERAARDLDRDPVDCDRVVEPLDDVLEPDVRSRLGARHSASFTQTCLIRVYSSIE